MYTRYKYHDEAASSYNEDSMCCFHTMKHVFFLRRAGKMGMAKANPLETEIIKKRMVDEKTNADTWMVSKTRRNLHALRHYICNEIDIVMQLAANLNCRRIFLMTYCVGQIS